jgi:hypothetical protein
MRGGKPMGGLEGSWRGGWLQGRTVARLIPTLRDALELDAASVSLQHAVLECGLVRALRCLASSLIPACLGIRLVHRRDQGSKQRKKVLLMQSLVA